MSIKIYPNSRIYVVAPAKTATGGPELLHQLAYHLRKSLFLEAFMFYVPNNHPDPIHPEYKDYNNPFVREIVDDKNNIIIVPEIKLGLEILEQYHKIRKIRWWLSVDNFYLTFILGHNHAFLFRRVINKISKLMFNKTIFDLNEIVLNKINEVSVSDIFNNYINLADYHFAQSFYAFQHLKSKGISEKKIYFLSDYLNVNFLDIKTDLSKKENIVAYNPKKGFAFTEKIIKAAPDIKFVPLVNMTRKQVIETLQKAKVYIDFGNHPGKDRIPREAAILGCCVITGKRGSAAFFEDVPIADDYKFEDKVENIPKIVDKIRDCFDNFEERYKDFDYCREVTKNGQQEFLEDLKKIFVKVTRKCT